MLVAEDEPILRTALAELIADEPSLSLVAVAATTRETVEQAALHRPDIALLDVRLAGGGGPDAARQIARVSPGTRVLALSASDERSAVIEMLRAGAVGYLLKGGPITEIVQAVHLCVQGQVSLGPEVAAGVIDDLVVDLRRREQESEQWRERHRSVEGFLTGEGLSVAWQPIFDLGTASLVAVEALARFRGGGDRPPDAWFAEAEAVGLRVPLELKALEVALGHLERLPPGVRLAVNLSSGTAMSPLVAALLGDVPVERVVLELAEHAEVGDDDRLRAALAPLRTRGMHVAVDDAGYSTLRHLLHLAPDLIKLDLRLAHQVHTDPGSRALASGLVGLAGGVGAAIVAQAIERPEELAALVSLGVSQAQGYHLGRPGALEEVLAAGPPEGLRVRTGQAVPPVGVDVLREALDAAPVAMALTSADGRVLHANRALCRLLGRPERALVGSGHAGFTHPDDLASESEALAAVRRGENPGYETEMRLVDGSGRSFWARVVVSAVGGGPGPTHLVRTFEDVSERRSERQTLLAHVVKAQEDERRRIAAEVHDDSLQAVAAASIRLQLLRRRLQDPEALEVLGKLEDTVQQAVRRLRGLLFQLQLPTLDDVGLAGALRCWLEGSFEGDDVAWSVEDRLAREPPPETRAMLYRIAQEALVNVRKHARAPNVKVVVEERQGGVLVSIGDDGVGFDAEAEADRPLSRHIGLASMRERAALAGGWHEVRSAPGQGTVIRFWTPSLLGAGEG